MISRLDGIQCNRFAGESTNWNCFLRDIKRHKLYKLYKKIMIKTKSKMVFAQIDRLKTQ